MPTALQAPSSIAGVTQINCRGTAPKKKSAAETALSFGV